jgi:plastocyanin
MGRLLGLLVVASVLVACGSGGTSTEEHAELVASEGDGAESRQEAVEIHATATNFVFTPDRWVVPAGAEVTLELTNDSNLEHDWVLLEPNTEISSAGEFDRGMVVWDIKAEAGESVTGAFTAPESGTYPVICSIEGLRASHFVAGMKGTLEVE